MVCGFYISRFQLLNALPASHWVQTHANYKQERQGIKNTFSQSVNNIYVWAWYFSYTYV